MPEPQNFKNHSRIDPAWHFILMPVLLANLIIAITDAIHHWPADKFHSLWWVVLSMAAILAAGLIRDYSLKVQNRVIRLEERLRLAALLPAEELTRSHSLTVSQLIGLRFASDAEVPALVKRTLDENLTAKQIKESIVSWRPDYLRV